MKFEAIDRVLKMTLILTVVSFIPGILFFSFEESLGFSLGALFACINFFLFNLIAKSATSETPQPRKVAFLLALKFPLLYLIGIQLIMSGVFSLNSMLLGPLLLIVATLITQSSSLLSKAAIWTIILSSTAPLYASLDSDVPEVPNIFTLLHKTFDSPLTAFLHHWETFIFATIVAIFLSVIFHLASRNLQEIPSNLQNFAEWAIDILKKFIISILGSRGEQCVPFLGTLFLYILIMNWLAIIPFMKPPTSNFNITIALALCVFGLVQYLNFKSWGFLGFIYHMAGSPKSILDWLLVPLMLPIELLTQLTRPLTLALRLFGNVVGEDILIGAAALFGVYLLSSSSLVGGLPMQLPFLFLALLTGLMQALVFTLLSTIYILLSLPHEDKHS
ncbi:hypothetical protein PHSC3_000730 [Chlamydiales bacterium STE3]|nr:hypothetical protein PHSC3_000730 [Chlamydiales bacterium STE3]